MREHLGKIIAITLALVAGAVLVTPVVASSGDGEHTHAFSELAFPSAPRTATATEQPNADILVEWLTPSQGILASYSIYRDGEFIGSVGDTLNSFTDPAPGVGSYVYTVQGFSGISGDTVHNPGIVSNPAIGVVAPPPPSVPLNVTVTLSGGNVLIEWDAPATGTVAYYPIYRDGVQVAEPPGSQFEHTDSPGAGTYDYQVGTFGGPIPPANPGPLSAAIQIVVP